jgi:hypothetical protein
MITAVLSGFIYFLNIFSMIRSITLNCYDGFEGILVEMPPGRPFDFFLTSSTSKEKSVYDFFASALTLLTSM